MKKAIEGFIYFILTVIFIIIMLYFGGCTENQEVKNFGSKNKIILEEGNRFGSNGKIILEEGRKLVNITWKQNSLWILTKPMTATDVAESYEFSEESSFGVLEGTYTIIEVK